CLSDTFNTYIVIAGDKPEKGDKLYAIGYPEGVSELRGYHSKYTEGVFSSDVSDELFMQTAQVYHGSSGSGVYNKHGSLVGINTSIDTEMTGMNYAISIKAVKDFLKNAGVAFSEAWWGNTVKRNENSTFIVFCFTSEAPSVSNEKQQITPAPQPESSAKKEEAEYMDIWCDIRNYKRGVNGRWTPFSKGRTYRRHYRFSSYDFFVISPYTGASYAYKIDDSSPYNNNDDSKGVMIFTSNDAGSKQFAFDMAEGNGVSFITEFSVEKDGTALQLNGPCSDSFR
ncbi:S1 family peptidase, partial [Candidatus Tokpelaia sp.]|uniref:S1 family peptidase n=1 Tax=Candidatus Tokpelaia sp. TaxID=2233777 RepID=UPI00123ACB20